MKTVNKKLTFKYFNYKWGRVPTWARATDHIYEQWYLTRYGYKNHAGLKKFLKNKKSILEAGCGLPTRCGLSRSAVVTKSMTAAATASGRSSVMARRAGGVRTIS